MYDIHKQGIAMCPTDLSDKQQALDKSSTRLFSALKLLFVEATHAALKLTLFHILAKHQRHVGNDFSFGLEWFLLSSF